MSFFEVFDNLCRFAPAFWTIKINFVLDNSIAPPFFIIKSDKLGKSKADDLIIYDDVPKYENEEETLEKEKKGKDENKKKKTKIKPKNKNQI